VCSRLTVRSTPGQKKPSRQGRVIARAARPYAVRVDLSIYPYPPERQWRAAAIANSSARAKEGLFRNLMKLVAPVRLIVACDWPEWNKRIQLTAGFRRASLWSVRSHWFSSRSRYSFESFKSLLTLSAGSVFRQTSGPPRP
jgi:hypothetical protein